METLLAITIGILGGTGVFLLLRASFFHIIIGIALLGQAANLIVFTAAGLGGGDTAIIEEGAAALPEGHPDPLAQALVLTAVVIGFGVLAFCLVLLKQTHAAASDSNVDSLKKTEER